MEQLNYAAAYITKSVDGDARTVDAVVSSDVIDSHGDIIDQKTWRLDRYKKNPIVLRQHDQSTPIGTSTSIDLRGNELHATVKFATTYSANEAWRLIKDGALRAFSVGFRIGNVKKEMVNGREVDRLLDCELMEISLVSIPANPDAVMKHKALGLVPQTYELPRGSSAIRNEAHRRSRLSDEEQNNESVQRRLKHAGF